MHWVRLFGLVHQGSSCLATSTNVCHVLFAHGVMKCRCLNSAMYCSAVSYCNPRVFRKLAGAFPLRPSASKLPPRPAAAPLAFDRTGTSLVQPIFPSPGFPRHRFGVNRKSLLQTGCKSQRACWGKGMRMRASSTRFTLFIKGVWDFYSRAGRNQVCQE